jgi:hypothetical protein
MRRTGVFLLVLVAVGVATAGDSFAVPGPVEPPEGILVRVSASHCYTPKSRIKVTVSSLTAGSSARANSEETVSAAAKASAAGIATISLVAPSRLPAGRRIEAHLIEVVGTDATGRTAGTEAAFVFGTQRVCWTLNRR